MSNQLTCSDPYGYVPGLDNGNASGPSPLSNPNATTWYSGLGEVISVSKTITIDSVFASFTLNQQGGNYSTAGYLYEIWLTGFVNNGINGNVINGGHSLFLTNGLTLDCYDLLVIDTQDVNDPSEGNITKVLVADPLYSEELSAYVSSIQQGFQSFSVSTTALTEYANNGVFRLENDISHRVNFNAKDLSLLINKPLIPYTTYGSLWIDSPKDVLSYPQMAAGNSLRLQKRNNPESGFEVVISDPPTYRGQVNDETTNDVALNLNNVRVGDSITLTLVAPCQFNYQKGDDVYVSSTLIDVKSGSYGIQYIKCMVVSFASNVLELMVKFRPSGASASGTKWYIISEVDQINIPISSNYYFWLLDDPDMLEYDLLSCVFSVRLQIDENKRFNRYVFRYKPDNSSSWKYIETTETNTIINNVLPNTIFDEEIMGFNDSTGDYCGFSDSGTFNTFF